MSQIINSALQYVDEMLEGLVAANRSLVRLGEAGRVVGLSTPGDRARVGIVSGGGSGHLPLFTGYVGSGLLDACAIGNVFEGPNVQSCMEAIRVADRGRGVLCLYGNYGGDRMNFDMASELAEAEGIETSTVLGIDDVASASFDEHSRRRGVAGIIYAYKTAGALAALGASLADVTEMARRTVERTKTIGFALSPCRLPGAAVASFELAEGEIGMGMGIHGEPGIWQDRVKPADDLADEMLDRLMAEALGDFRRVTVLVNSLGATPLEELFILYRRLARRLSDHGVEIVLPLVGRYTTSMEMAGASVSLCFLDEDIEPHLLAPASCPFWTVP
ncbi:MAG: dihydroxyacetone kinase subunit DhaK [Hyphomicrobiaceae bacterium]|nr:dihydroxyacetone kinase subunit DhaK [Hyphomicrobiaceae bacterium]